MKEKTLINLKLDYSIVYKTQYLVGRFATVNEDGAIRKNGRDRMFRMKLEDRPKMGAFIVRLRDLSDLLEKDISKK
jgi:hypothetical protein